jgi:phosphocarrier protein
MTASSVTVKNPSGLHARLASQFCELARSFGCTVVVRSGGRLIPGCNILDMMAANIRQGETLVIHCDGREEDRALKTLLQYIGSLDE